MDLLTRLDCYEIGRRFILTRAEGRIDASVVDTQGSNANLIVGSGSFMAYAVMQQLGERIGALLLDSAEKEDLDRYAWDRYQMTRKGASPAKGEVDFERPTVAGGAGSILTNTKVKSLTGIEYITLTDAAFGASTLSVKNVKVRAVQAGKQYQVGKNQLRLVAAFDPTITVTNPNATAGGEDPEEDPDFKERVRDFWSSARRGTLKAIVFGAKTVAGVSSAMAVEALSSVGLPARVVNLFIADSSGVASASLGSEVNVALEEYRAAGIAVILYTSIPQITRIEMKLSFLAGVDTSTLTDLIRAAIFEYVNSVPVNGTLYRAGLFSVLQRFASRGLVVKESTFIEPQGDIVPAPGQTIRTTLDQVVVVT